MKRFFINLLFAVLIASFVYFVVAGKSVSDLVGKETLERVEGNEIVKNARDTIIGPYSGTSSDKSIFQKAKSVGKSLVDSQNEAVNQKDGNNEENKRAENASEKKAKEGPLSDLLDDNSEDSDKKEDNQKAKENNSEDTNKESEEEDTKKQEKDKERNISQLPEFDLICTPSFKQVCDFEGCKREEVSGKFSLINEEEGRVFNCISGKCEGFSVKKREFESSFNYNFNNLDKGGVRMLSREIDSQDNISYVEFKALGSQTEAYFGECK